MSAAGAAKGGRLGSMVQEQFRQRPLIAWLVVLAVAVVLYVRVAEPVMEWAGESRQRAETLAQSLATYQSLAAKEKERLAQLKARVGELEDQATELAKMAPDKARHELANKVRALAEAKGLTVDNSQLLPPRQEAGLTLVAVGLSARGSYGAVLDFLAAVGKEPAPIYLESYTLSPAAEEKGLALEARAATLVRAK